MAKKAEDVEEEAVTNDKGNWATFGPQFRKWSILFLLAIIVICGLPYLLTQQKWIIYDLTPYGTVGDAINGIMGPFIAILGAYLVFIAFWVQYMANAQQRHDTEIERFETSLFDLIRLHTENVNSIRITDEYTGRNAFIALYNELRFTFYFVKHHVDQYPRDVGPIDLGFARNDDETILRIAYLIFYLGLGDESEQLWFEQLETLDCSRFLIQNLRVFVRSQQNVKRFRFRIGKNFQFEYRPTHIPFLGHMSDLGHYYRHLYQTVKFVDQAPHLQVNYNKQYEYARILRAQLSTYEQILLYYNTFSRFGKPWLDTKKPYLTKYKMIKNIPLPLADFGVRPEVKFAKEVDETKEKSDKFFEWHELNEK